MKVFLKNKIKSSYVLGYLLELIIKIWPFGKKKTFPKIPGSFFA